MDRIDQSILSRLQTDSQLPLAQLAAGVGLSPSACHRRVRMLEEAGVIAGYSARLNRAALGLTMELFVTVSLISQSSEALEAFEKAVQGVPEILSCYLLAGRADYIMRIAVKDMDDFERIHRQKLARLPGVSTMTTSFSLRTVKEFRGFPVGL
jgi:DNA-binding Lrp family transcriptional regulator